MINDTIKIIESTINDSGNLSEERKNELLDLVEQLKNEISNLDESQQEQAGSIASFAESSVREAVKSEQDSELLEHSLKGLTLSVRRFEVSHPTLIGIINNIGRVLNNLGI